MQSTIIYSNGVVMPPTNTTASHVHWDHKCPDQSQYIDPCIFIILFAQLISLVVSLFILKQYGECFVAIKRLLKKTR